MTTADWLAAQAERADELDPRLGVLAVLVAGLEGADQLRTPSPALIAPWTSELTRLPPQLERWQGDPAFAAWIAVAALAEMQGHPALSLIVLVRLQQLLRDPGPPGPRSASPRADAPGTPSAEALREAIAFCWARRGRVVRIAGQLEDAEACYREAIRLTRTGSWADARTHAEMGLAIVAYYRGNLPESERRTRQLLARRPAVSELYQVQAHQMLALTRRRRGALLDALLHGWAAYDLLAADDMRRSELLVSLADIALEAGNIDAAVQGYHTVAASDVPWRIRVPALTGRLDALTRRAVQGAASTTAWGGGPTRDSADARIDSDWRAAWEATAHAATAAALAPGDQVLAALALARSALALRQFDVAAQWCTVAGELAAAHGYHEKQFIVESLERTLSEARAETAGASTAQAEITRANSDALASASGSAAKIARAARGHALFARFASVQPLVASVS